MRRIDKTEIEIDVSGPQLQRLFGVDEAMVPCGATFHVSADGKNGVLTVTFRRRQARWKSPNYISWNRKPVEMLVTQ